MQEIMGGVEIDEENWENILNDVDLNGDGMVFNFY